MNSVQPGEIAVPTTGLISLYSLWQYQPVPGGPVVIFLVNERVVEDNKIVMWQLLQLGTTKTKLMQVYKVEDLAKSGEIKPWKP